MIYRDDATAARARLHALREELTVARAGTADAESLELTSLRRRLACARRAVARLRHPLRRLFPFSVVELAMYLGYGIGVVLATVSLAWVAGGVVAAAATVHRRTKRSRGGMSFHGHGGDATTAVTSRRDAWSQGASTVIDKEG